MAKHVAIKRLLADLKQMLANPQLDIVARPQEDNLLVWHANLRGCGEGGAAASGPLGGVPIHAVLIFPETYPKYGPEVRLFHALPHRDVSSHTAPPEKAQGAGYRVSLFDCNMWCWDSMNSVTSILVMLHCHLLDPLLLQGTDKIDEARAAALGLVLTGHPHRGSAPVPAFPTPEEVAKAPRLHQIQVKRPPVNKELLTAPLTVPKLLKAAIVDPDGWREVGDKGIRPRRAVVQLLADSLTSSSPTPALPPLPQSAGCFALLAALDEAEQGTPAAEAAAVIDTGAPALPLLPQSAGCFALLAALDEAEQGASAAEAASVVDTGAPALPPLPQSAGCFALLAALDEAEQGTPAAETAAGVDTGAAEPADGSPVEVPSLAAEGTIVATADHREGAGEHASAGPLFDLLTPDALAHVLLCMESRDVAALGATCRSLRASAADGMVWRAQLRSRFPHSRLVPADLADYRLAVQLEADAVVPELSCLYTGVPFGATVLGYRYNACERELVSVEAVQAGLTQRFRTSPVLPAYITAEHFERAQAVLPAVLRQLVQRAVQNIEQERLRQLCPQVQNPGPEAWLSVLPIELNKFVMELSQTDVILYDSDLDLEEYNALISKMHHNALMNYCGVYRTLLALCDRHNLWERASHQVDLFVSHPAQRVKSETPNLGDLAHLMALSRRHDWRDVLPLILIEAIDRSVVLACHTNRSLIRRYSRDPERGGVDHELVEGVFRKSRHMFRSFMLHFAFLSLVARPHGQPLREVMYHMDCTYGLPGAGLQRRFHALVDRILKCKGLNEALEIMEMRPLSPEAWTRRLRQAWLNSLAKGYRDRRRRGEDPDPYGYSPRDWETYCTVSEWDTLMALDSQSH